MWPVESGKCYGGAGRETKGEVLELYEKVCRFKNNEEYPEPERSDQNRVT